MPIKTSFVKQFFLFGWIQIICCIFPAFIFCMLVISHWIPDWIPRYDFMLAMCLLMQIVMYRTKLETKQELLVITLFHLLGLSMELFKVAHGSWAYPEFAYTKIAEVPLYSGFMYASVASYMCQAWRRFDLKLLKWPKPLGAWTVAIVTYLNFFTHHYIDDLRWWLASIILFTFFQSKVQFQVNKKKYTMPVAVSFLLIGFFIWIAENIATYFDAWKYAHQVDTWSPVHLQKISSWALMVIISYIIVAQLQIYSGKKSTLARIKKH